jgi:hypothetical protein
MLGAEFDPGIVSAPLQSWVTLVIAGAIQTIGHIVAYRKKKKAKKEARKQQIAELQAAVNASNKNTNPMLNKGLENKISPKQVKSKSTASFDYMPIAIIGGIAVIGALLLRRKP